MSVPTRSCASAVEAPTWGVATTRGMLGEAPVHGRLLGVDVEGGAGHAAALERREQRLVVDQLAARGVHDAHAGLHLGEGLLAEQVPGLAA